MRKGERGIKLGIWVKDTESLYIGSVCKVIESREER